MARGPREDPEVITKVGNIWGVITPGKMKKLLEVTVSNKRIVAVDVEKHFFRPKGSSIQIELKKLFNVHTDHWDPRLQDCIAVVGPEESLYLRADTEEETEEWYRAIYEVAYYTRITYLRRIVPENEFFEYVWDIEVVHHPKLKKPIKMEEELPSMCDKTPGLTGRKRLCFYSQNLVLAKTKIEPTLRNSPQDNIPPFSMDDFIELNRKYIATFGCGERYFWVRMGRGSVLGACELWARCENEEVASKIHEKLNKIIDRETDKKKSNLFASHPYSRLMSYRDRALTQPHRSRTSTTQGCRRVGSPSGSSSSRKPSTAGIPHFGFENPFGTRHSLALAARLGSLSSTNKSNPLAGRRLSETPSTKSKTSSLASSSRMSTATNDSGDTEDSNSTIKAESNGSKETIKLRPDDKDKSKTDEPPLESDYIQMDHANFSQGSCFLTPRKEQIFHLEEVRSYISDSNDSCYSSAINNTGANSKKPKVTSLGSAHATTSKLAGKTTASASGAATDASTSGEATSKDKVLRAGLHLPLDPAYDPRQRAFSLGSNNNLSPQRKLSGPPARVYRPAHLMAHKMSLQRNCFAQGMPASPSTHQMMSNFYHPELQDIRPRSNSFGSGRSTPFNRKAPTAPQPAVRNSSSDHLLEIDFGGPRSGSSSVHSESPARTSSISRKLMSEHSMDDFRHLPRVHTGHSMHRPERKISEKKFEKKKLTALDYGDYVPTEVADPASLLAQVKAADTVARKAKERFEQQQQMHALAELVRPVPHFETIEESVSGNNSRCSSTTSLHHEDENLRIVSPIILPSFDEAEASQDVATPTANSKDFSASIKDAAKVYETSETSDEPAASGCTQKLNDSTNTQTK